MCSAFALWLEASLNLVFKSWPEQDEERQRLFEFRPLCRSAGDVERLVSRYERTFNATTPSWLFNCHGNMGKWGMGTAFLSSLFLPLELPLKCNGKNK